MRAKEFTNFSFDTEPYEGWTGEGIIVRAYDGKDEVGHVIFEPTEDDDTQWYAVDVEVEELYQRRGIATHMYNIAKKAAQAQGKIIVRSHTQSEAGRGLWQDKRVWEDSMTAGRNLSPTTEKYIKNHKWKLTTVDPMNLDIDSFDDPFNRVIDIDTEHPVNLKDPVIVHHNGSTIIDGFHRVYQAQRQGLTSIPAYIPTKEELDESSTPQVLYHATYRPLLKSIKQHGLGGDKAQAKWEDSKPGVVYLATDPNVAESYAESSDVVPDEWLDQIVVLKVNASQLDQSKLKLDRNVIDNEGDTLEYHGVIPVNLLS